MADSLHDAIQRWQQNSPTDEDVKAINRALRAMAHRVKAGRYRNVHWIIIDDLVTDGLSELRIGGQISTELDRLCKLSSGPLTDSQVFTVFFFQLSECARRAGADKGRHIAFGPYDDAQRPDDSPTASETVDLADAVQVALRRMSTECNAYGIPFQILRIWISIALSPPESGEQSGRHIERFRNAAGLSRPKAEAYDSICKQIVHDQITIFTTYSPRTMDVVAFVRRLVADC